MNSQPITTHQSVQGLLDRLTEALRAAHLWSEQAPSAEALASKMPFCCDTLSFESWLQFVFLPKMYHLLEHNLPLPNQLVIAPMAEQSWLTKSHMYTSELNKVYCVLKEIDDYFGERSQ